MHVISEVKYSEAQPRWPAGDPRGGQWRPATSAADGEEGSGNAFGIAPDGTPIEPAGGIPEDKLNWTTQQFMSAYCKGNIREVMPGQFLGMTIEEVMALAKQGDKAARSCLKLLSRGRFQK